MKRLNLDFVRMATNTLLVAALVMWMISIEGQKAAALAAWGIVNYFFVGILASAVSLQDPKKVTMPEATVSVTMFIGAISPMVICLMGHMSTFNTVLLTEAIKFCLFLPIVMAAAQNNPKFTASQVFWRLVISTAVFDAGLLAIYNGASFFTGFIAAAAILLIWIMKDKNEEEKVAPNKLAETCRQENRIVLAKEGLQTAAIPMLLMMGFLQVRGIYLAVKAAAPEQQAKLIGETIIMMITAITIIAIGFLLYRELGKRLDSLWGQKKEIITA
jgi:hypothetical protein